MNVARIAVNYPLKNAGLLYLHDAELEVGQVVEVPLGKRKALGCVISLNENESPEFKNTDLKKFKSVIDSIDGWKLTTRELELYTWMSQYYHYGLGQLIFDCQPRHLKRPRPIQVVQGQGHELEFSPNEKQLEVIGGILGAAPGFQRFLIHGVTGSGKTVIYLELIRSFLAAGKSVLFLLPEINLTPQFIETFSRYLDAEIYSYHSELADSQRYHIWSRARDMQRGALVLGVRSSIFIPVSNLGLIIIDEEHDGSFKQDDRCPYNARDVASKKAQLLDIPLVMGSATPSVETYQAFHRAPGNPNLFELPDRAGAAYLPAIDFIDARDKSGVEEGSWPLTTKAVTHIREALQRKEQILIFVNRLGYANYLQCRGCGSQFSCPNCSITLRYHKRTNVLACHHCEYHEPFPNSCTACGCMTLSQKGFGTEKVQEVLQNLFPEKRIERFDREEIKNFKQLEQRLDDFHQGAVDLMVGTQMLSKGHNFEKVKLVLILGIDSQLNFPDFRSNERVYQTLTQVAGRAGRYSKDGKVLIQTLNPEHELFKVVQDHAFHRFYEDELRVRSVCSCPPYQRLVMLHFSSRFQDRLIYNVSEVVAPMLRSLVRAHFPEVSILGPRPASIEKKSNQFTWSFLLKSQELKQLHNLLNSFELNFRSPSNLSYKIDIDPYSML